MFKANQNQKPMIIGSIANEEDRKMLSGMLAQQRMTLDDVEVISLAQAEEKGLFENEQFLAYIRKMGFNSGEEMKATYQRMARNGAVGNGLDNK